VRFFDGCEGSLERLLSRPQLAGYQALHRDCLATRGTPAAEPIGRACVDDPDGALGQYGLGCAAVLGVEVGWSCGLDLGAAGWAVGPPGTTLAGICPASCQACGAVAPPAPPPAPARPPPTARESCARLKEVRTALGGRRSHASQQ
jgi:hypothetical protein